MTMANHRAAADRGWAALPVPYAIDMTDRIPKERYFDPEFFAMEAELLWPKVWQMACRLEEIPEIGDFAEYEILDQSVLVVRTEHGVRAYENVCRHRGVRLAHGRGSRRGGFVCSFHGWCYGTDGQNTKVTQAGAFAAHNVESADLNLTAVRCEVWGGCAWINFDNHALPVRDCLQPMTGVLDAWKVETLRAEWWYACKLPANWKLAQEAFVEQYHVLQAHPQLRIPGRFPPRPGVAFDAASFKEAELQYLRMMSEGMAGMVHAHDVHIAETLAAGMELPPDYPLARASWEQQLNKAVTDTHIGRGCTMPDLNDLEARGINQSMGYCFPHYFVLPMYSSASSYRFRPLGPEETLMEIWSLTRYPAGQEPQTPPNPEPWTHDDPRWPAIPAQDFSNIPRQQRGLHARGFEYMRLSEKNEGHISNYHRVIDGYLAGLPSEHLVPWLRSINVNPLEMPIVNLERPPS